jgi:hypothetical protein
MRFRAIAGPARGDPLSGGPVIDLELPIDVEQVVLTVASLMNCRAATRSRIAA